MWSIPSCEWKFFRPCFLGCVEIGFFLGFANVLLVSYPLVAKPVGYLRYCDATLSSQLFLGFFTRIRITEVRVKVFIQNLGRLFAEVSPLSSCIQEPTSKDHHCLTRALLQLNLNRVKLFVNNLHHPFNFFRSDWSCTTLFSKQVHDMSRKFVAGLFVKTRCFISCVSQITLGNAYLFIFLEFLVINCSNLGKFGSVVRVFNCIFSTRVSGSSCCCRWSRGWSTTSLFWSCYSFGDEHVVQPHQLRIRRFFFLCISKAEHCVIQIQIKKKENTSVTHVTGHITVWETVMSMPEAEKSLGNERQHKEM